MTLNIQGFQSLFELKKLVSLTPIVLVLYLMGCSSAMLPSGPSQQLSDSGELGLIDSDVEKSSQMFHSFLVGRLAFLDLDQETALQELQRASDLGADSAREVQIPLAELYVMKGDLGKAQGEVEKLIKSEGNSTSNLLLYAGILEASDQLEKAKEIYLKLHEEENTIPESYLLLSSIYSRLNQNERGIAVLNKLLAKEPNNVMGNYYLSRLYESQADKEQREGNLRKAAKYLNKTYQLRADFEPAIQDLCRVYLKLNDNSALRKFAAQVLLQNPKNAVAKRLLGELALGEGQFDTALAYLEELKLESAISSSVDGSDSDLNLRIALIYLEKRDLKAAERELNLILAKNPRNGMARYTLASILSSTGRLAEAMENLEQIEEQSPIYAKSNSLLAVMYRQENNHGKAIESIQRVIDLEPKNRKAHVYLLFLLRESGQVDKARRLVEELLQKHPDDERLKYEYGLILFDDSQPTKAIEAMQAVVELNPKNSDALNFIAYTLSISEGDLLKAEEYANQALAIQPNQPYYLDTLGWIYFKLGELERAEETLLKAYTKEPNDLVIVEHYLIVLESNSKSSKAQSIAKQKLENGLKGDRVDLEQQKVYQRLKEKYAE